MDSMNSEYFLKQFAEIQPFLDQLGTELTAQNFSSIKVFNKPAFEPWMFGALYDTFMSDKYYTGVWQSTLQQSTIDKLILFMSWKQMLTYDLNNFSKLFTTQIANNMV